MLKSIINSIQWRIAGNDKRIDILRKTQGITIGQGCEIYREVAFGSEPYLITIGNNVRITSGVRFITHDGGVWVIRNRYQLNNVDLFGKIVIKDNVHIGVNAIIMPGVTIGSNVIIGCGAIVTKDIPDNSIAVGVPARVIESVEEFYEKNKEDFEMTKGFSEQQKKEYLIGKYI